MPCKINLSLSKFFNCVMISQKYIRQIVLSCILFFFGNSIILAQSRIVSQDSIANRLVEKLKKLNAAHQSMPGYRLQLYFGNDRAHANDLKTEFLNLYPKTSAYVLYRQPNFKLRVGDFKSRLEALKFLKEIQTFYNTAFIVQDEVKLPEE